MKDTSFKVLGAPTGGGGKVKTINNTKPDSKGNINVTGSITEQQEAAINKAVAMESQLTQLAQDMGELSGDVDGIVYDYGTTNTSLPLLCGQPPILFGAGTPQEAVVPTNWKQYDPVTDTGYQWNGQPSAVGQQYINTSASSGGRYIAVADANMNLTWKNF